MKTGFIDWTEGKLSFYVFEKKGGKYTLIDTISRPLEGGLSQAVLSSLAAPRVEHVYLSVPADLLSLRELDFPFSDKDKIKDTISFELEGLLLGDTSEYSIDHVVTELTESGSRALAVCVEKTKLREVIDLFSSVGLEPVMVSSIDLRLSGKNAEKLFDSTVADEQTRARAAGEELAAPTINLRQGDLAYKGDIERIKKSLRVTAVLVMIFLLMFGADIATKRISLKKQNSLLTKEISSLFREAFPEDKKIVDVSRQFSANLKILKGKKAILAGMPVLDILLQITELQKEDITLGEFNIDKAGIIIKGSASSFENVDSFKSALSSAFTEVKVLDSESLPDKKITFSIIMGLKT
ncbi:GspL periplasmic domain protein [bacterium BMS3Abin10]|nr:GspL periplasmic domain protein [bacterium BMS3Abin10]HDH49808.1 hypothetical protein [Nitrospirota bacterium]